MSPRTGRPKLAVTMDVRIGVRLDAETAQKLDKLVSLRKSTRSQIIRECIEREYQDAKK